MKQLALGILLLFAALNTEALTVYEWIDAHGDPHFSDTPQPGAVAVQISDVQLQQATMEPAQPQSTTPITPLLATNPLTAALGEVRIAWGSTEYNATNTTRLTVPVALNGALLANGGQVKLYIDGALSNLPFQTIPPAFMVTDLTRGAHTLQVKTFDAQGNFLNQSQVVNVYVQLAHLPRLTNS